MKHLLIRGLALSLGLLATSARGQETVWRSTPAAPSATSSEVRTSKPIAIAVSRPATLQPTTVPPTTPTAPLASLGRPLAIASTESPVQPVSYLGARTTNQPIVRGAAPDAVAKPLPSGDSMSIPSMGQGTWRRADDVVGVSRTTRSDMDPIASPTANLGPAIPGGSILPAPTPAVDSVGSSSIVSGQPITSIGQPLMPGGQPIMPGGQPIMSGSPQSSLFATNPADCGCNSGIKSGPVVDCAPGCGCGKSFVGGRMIAGSGGCASGTCGGGAGGPPASSAGGGWGHYGPPMHGGMGGDSGAMDPSQFVLNVESLVWWMKGDRTPPLAVAVPAPGGIPTGTGSTLIGGGSLGDKTRGGLRASAIYWFSEEHCWGLEVGGFVVGLQNDRYRAGGDASINPIIGRPFTDTSAGSRAALELVAGLGLLQGNVDVVRRSTLWGYDINFRRNLANDCNFSMDLLLGFREVGLDESLSITENLNQTAAIGTFPAGSNFVVNDKFSASNRFYGGQVGLAGQWRISDAWSLGFTGKVAVGCTTHILDINGSTTVTTGGVSQALPGGLLTQQGTNIGHYTRKTFGVVPEGGLTLGYNITDWWKLTAGYNFLYWSNVVRPGEQINTNVNRTLLPFRGGAQVPGADPSFTRHSSDYFAQGLTFGMQFTF